MAHIGYATELIPSRARQTLSDTYVSPRRSVFGFVRISGSINLKEGWLNTPLSMNRFGMLHIKTIIMAPMNDAINAPRSQITIMLFALGL
jgi:hypothetical protein